MGVALAGDHAGFHLLPTVSERILRAGHTVLPLGPDSLDPDDDYPDVAEAVGLAVKDGRADRGILVCGSGVGVCVAANKLPGVRASTCSDHYSAHQGVEHDDVNVLCLGARIIGVEVALEIVDAFLAAEFSGDTRHVRRRDKVRALEARWMRTT